MPQDSSQSDHDKDAIKASFRVKRLDLLGYFSRMLLAMLNVPPAAENHNGREPAGPSTMPLVLRSGSSFTNHSPLPARHNLAKGRGAVTPGESLSNMLSHRPARPQRPIENAPVPSKVQSDTTIREVAQFYIVFLWSVAKRQEDVKGLRLQDHITETMGSLIRSLPDNDRWILPADWLRPEEYLSSIEGRVASGKAPALDNIKSVYTLALQTLMTRLEERLDDSTVRLLFRLAARDAMRERWRFAGEYSLLEGIPAVYLRQLGSLCED
jgi:hypothetical protein